MVTYATPSSAMDKDIANSLVDDNGVPLSEQQASEFEQNLTKHTPDFITKRQSAPKARLDESDDESDHEGSDTDSESEPGKDVNGVTTSIRRISKKQQKDVFDKWFVKRAYDIQTNPKKHQEVDQNDEQISTKSLLSATTKAIISDPREYQLELFEKAKHRNTIAVLDTGSGKTLIATLLIRWILEQEAEERAKGRKPKICVFLVNSVTLVFQQAAVLECNLDAQIGKYCGEMGTDLWTREKWQEKAMTDKVFVATADTIFNCLTHSFLKISDFNLLIFDECHHTKKQHAYARIMREFYEPETAENRPRVFGMTASPVDARVDVVKAAQQLERLMHSSICTASDLTLLQKVFTKPVEETLIYPKLSDPPLSKLNTTLIPYRKVKCFSPIFRFIEIANRELGIWCTDRVWDFSLTELEAARQERRAGSRPSHLKTQDKIPKDPEEIEKEITLIKEARAIVENHKFERPNISLKTLSPKLLILYQYLHMTFTQYPEYKCIIFVTRRYTAKCIELLFNELGIKNVRLGVLFGTSGFQLGNDSMTFRQQTITLHRFRTGKLNCLIATSVAEEGLDVPDCNLVIRFDLYTTMIQYIQSRGRARHQRSRYIHMAESENFDHKKSIHEGQEAEKVMKSFCQKLPEDRLLDKPADVDFGGHDPTMDKIYFVPSTGAKLTLNSSMQVLARFIGRLSSDDGIAAETCLYIVEPVPLKGFKCEIKMPAASPVRSVQGQTSRSKAVAKQVAAFEACKQLHERKLLDDHLMPIYVEKIRPLMANAHLAVDSHKTNSYPSRLKPTFWDQKEPAVPKSVWCTMITLRDPQQLGAQSQGICIVTREKPPFLPAFPLYFDHGGESLVDLTTVDAQLDLDADRLEKLNRFTSRFFIDVFNKEFEITTESLPYWVLPLKTSRTPGYRIFSIEDMVDWDLVNYVQITDEISVDITTTPPDFYVGKFLLDRRDGSRRFYVFAHEPKYKPDDPIPEGVAKVPNANNILDYSYAAGKKGWQRWVKDLPVTQPVMLADRVLHRINCLDRPTEREISMNKKAYIVPSPFRISPLPAKFCMMGLLFPAVSTRVDAFLHAFDVCSLLNVDIDLDVALEAITKDSDNTSEHGEDPVNKRRGMGNNYERLEFLGDCFLKLGTTISLYAQNPDNDEFEYHVKRMTLVCNQNLFNRAKTMELYKYIQTKGFSRRLWYPAITLLRGKGAGKAVAERTHRLSDKSVADVCEALIGAALSNKGLDMAARMVTALLSIDEHKIFKFDDYYPLYKLPAYQIEPASRSQQELADKVEKDMGYKFKYPRLLRSAFTHSSYPTSWERIPCYERLEFLGDALIDMACVEDLWERYPSKDPQWLTEHKMSMINNRFQGAVCVKLGFHRYLHVLGQQISGAIQEYVTLVNEARIASNDSVDYWIDVKAPPKALPDILEAYVGAIFVDSEFNYQVVKDFYNAHIKPFFMDMTIFDSFAGNHPVTHLHARMQELGCQEFRIFSKEYKDRDTSYVLSVVMFHSMVLADGKASSQKNSRTNAAKQALIKLDQMGGDGFGKTCKCAELRKMEEEERKAERLKKAAEKEGQVPSVAGV